MADGQWDCEAYGPQARKAGALCFFAGELHTRVCGSLLQCKGRMIAGRQRVYQRINELAAAGDEDMAYLEGEFTSPRQLLGGEEDMPGEDEEK